MRTMNLLAVAVVLAGMTGVNAADEKPPITKPAGHQHGLSPSTAKCLDACILCVKECEACSRHCTAMLGDGKKDHDRALQLTRDCADLCGVTARLLAREGPLMQTSCLAAGKACELCAEECAKFKDSEQMQACAKACRECAKACQDVVRVTASEKRD